MTFRSAMRKIIPLRASTFEKARKKIEASGHLIEAQNVEIAASLDQVKTACERIGKNLEELDGTLEERIATIVESRMQSALDTANVGATLSEVAPRFEKLEAKIEDRSKAILSKQDATWNQAASANRVAKETLWAETFERSIIGSTWFKDCPLSPGRWAVGYPYLYALYRSLNEARPKKILEMGLGQSTNMIGKYAAVFSDVKHTVVEHDESWIDFYRSENALSERTEIVRLDLKMQVVPFCEHQVRVYEGFEPRLAQEKFDFISIDGPFGYDMKEFARIDALSILPEALEPSFTIMVDDYNRKGEQNMVSRIREALSNADIEFSEGKYEGEKTTLVICSKDRAFLTSL